MLLAAGLAVPVQAQRRELTLLAGGNLTTASGPHLEQVGARRGFAAGLSLRLPQTYQLILETNLLVTRRHVFGRRAPSDQPPVLAGPVSDDATLWFLELPILLRFQQGYSRLRPVRPFVQGGAFIGARLGCSRRVVEADGAARTTDCTVATGGSGGSETALPAVYQEVDLGLMGGAGIETGRFAVGLRVQRSLRNLVEPSGARTSPFDAARLWTILLSVEYLVRVL